VAAALLNRCRAFRTISSRAFLGQLVAGSIGEDGHRDGIAAIFITRSELDVGTLLGTIILSS
jgi:hypothetical protein